MTVRVSASHVGPGFNSRHLHHTSRPWGGATRGKPWS